MKNLHITDTTAPFRDHLSGCRAYYNELSTCNKLPDKISAAWLAVRTWFNTQGYIGIENVGRNGYDACNVDLYDIAELPGGVVLVLTQWRRTFKKKADYFAEIKKVYELYATVSGRVMQVEDIEITGQAVHAAIRAGRSPINRMLEKPKFRQAIEVTLNGKKAA